MKECAYCGRQNEDAAMRCQECGTDEFKTGALAKVIDPEPDPKDELVTLLSARNLPEADLIKGRLGAAGVEVFIPDEFLMQAVGFNLNTFGYVRVQVLRKDLAKAKELLSAPGEQE
jgi:Putative prokaryotic signal transducing protein